MVAANGARHVGSDFHSLSAHAQLLADTGREEEAQLYFERAITAADSKDDCCAPALGLTLGWYALMMEGRGQV
jgi:predicted RNA polymerase sigma factor